MTVMVVLAYVAPIASAVLLAASWMMGDLEPRAKGLLLTAFAVAIYLQFFGQTMVASVAGLLVQTSLAIYLAVRWHLSQL
jgi:hypothetical protein